MALTSSGVKRLTLPEAPRTPPIFGLGNTAGFEVYIQNRGEGGAAKLANAMYSIQGAASQSKILAGVQSLWKPASPQLKVNVDREKAKALGIPLDSAFNTLAAQCRFAVWGGDGYQFGLLASGGMDIAVESGIKLHDFAALAPVVIGAGGIMTDWQGRALDKNSGGNVIAAATPQLYTAVQAVLKDAE